MKNFLLTEKFTAFTLAEVIITIGIIGVVAAMTISNLINNYKNNIVETKLKKIYSIMNQAINLSENTNGNLETWDFENANFLKTYITPYLNQANIKEISSNNKYSSIYLIDGSLLITKNIIYGTNLGANSEFFFYPDAKNFVEEEFFNRQHGGSKFFLFKLVYPKSYCNPYQRKGFEPYLCAFNKTDNPYIDGLYACNKENSFKFLCTYVIQRNGWKIPDDYPIKVK